MAGDASGMHETAEREPRRKGLWWKSLIGAWLALQPVGLVAWAVGVDIPDELGFPALIVLWMLIWTNWWRRSRRGQEGRRFLAPGALGVMQQVFLAVAAGILLIGNVVLILDNTADLKRTAVPAGVVAASVVAIGLLSFLGGRIAVPSLDPSDATRLVTTYRSLLFARLAWAESPAIVAFAGFLLLGGEAWVYVIGLAASLVGLLLAAPTRAALRREQEHISASGSSLDLLEVMTTGRSGPH